MRSKINTFLHANRSDKRAFVTLFLFIFFSLTLQAGIKLWMQPMSKAQNKSDFSATYLAYLEQIKNDKAQYGNSYYGNKDNKRKKSGYFSFNPNKINYSDAMKLGFSPKLFNTLDNYRNAGGGFSKKSELKKLYGMSDELFNELIPFMELQADIEPKNEALADENTNLSNPDAENTDAENNSLASNLDPSENVSLFPFDPNTVSRQTLEDFGINKKAAFNWQQFRASGGKFNNLADVERIYDILPQEIARIEPFLRFSPTSQSEETPLLSDTNLEIKEPYPFDPNKISKKALLELGIEELVAINWLSLRKRAPFYELADVEKIVGLPRATLNTLAPFMFFPEPPNLTYEEQIMADAEAKAAELELLADEPTPKIDKKIKPVELNSATKKQLMQLPYIKEARANLILKHRDALGGFVKIEQLKDIYGIDETAFAAFAPYLTVDVKNANFKQININTATADELKAHLNVSWQIANSIVKIRQQNGNFNSVDDLKRSYLMDKKLLETLKPYLKVE